MEFTSVLETLSSFFSPSNLTKKTKTSQTIMLLSPHPDDEAINTSIALRLMHENGAHVVNVAVTLGSNRLRQTERLKELKRSCQHLGMDLIILDDNWKKKEKELKNIIQKYAPALILAPHSKDRHPTHERTAELLKKVLARPKGGPLLVAWGEFWGQMTKPNMLVEVPQQIVEMQIKALEMHVGEIARNPYHLRLPAWMMDNVRRGSELIQGPGSEANNMAFGVLYQLQKYRDGRASTPKIESIWTSHDDLSQIFKLTFEAAAGSKTRVK